MVLLYFVLLSDSPGRLHLYIIKEIKRGEFWLLPARKQKNGNPFYAFTYLSEQNIGIRRHSVDERTLRIWSITSDSHWFSATRKIDLAGMKRASADTLQIFISRPVTKHKSDHTSLITVYQIRRDAIRYFRRVHDLRWCPANRSGSSLLLPQVDCQIAKSAVNAGSYGSHWNQRTKTWPLWSTLYLSEARITVEVLWSRGSHKRVDEDRYGPTDGANTECLFDRTREVLYSAALSRQIDSRWLHGRWRPRKLDNIDFGILKENYNFNIVVLLLYPTGVVVWNFIDFCD